MAIYFRDVAFEYSNGRTIFSQLSCAFPAGTKSGVVGPNGVGKSTLVRLAIGDLEPTRGQVQRPPGIAFLRQSELPPARSVGEVLGDLWSELDPSSRALLKFFLAGIPEERLCAELSLGEWTRVRLARLLRGTPEFLVLDEPANHLDRSAREALIEFLRCYPGGVLLVSHDRAVLRALDRIVELSTAGVQAYGEGGVRYFETRVQERQRLEHALQEAERAAENERKRTRERIESQEKRSRQARKNARSSGLPRFLIGARKRRAQETLGNLVRTGASKEEARIADLAGAFERQKRELGMNARLEADPAPAGRLLREARGLNFRHRGGGEWLWPRDLDFVLRGTERVAITGSNGSGKSTLLRLLFGEVEGEQRGEVVRPPVRTVILDQGLNQLREEDTVLEHFAHLSKDAARALLARFLFFRDEVYAPVATLSGGERLRLGLAQALAAPAPPQLLVLDEPTNALDLKNVEFLEGALSSFAGALLVVSHDEEFLEKIGIHWRIEL